MSKNPFDGFPGTFVVADFDPSSRGAAEDYARRMMGMDPRDFRFAGRSPYDIDPRELVAQFENMRQQLANAQGTIIQYADAIAKLKEAAAIYAVVTKVRGQRVALMVAGKAVEVSLPKDKKIGAGMTVKVLADSMQILDVVEDADASGEVASVTRIARPGLCEVDRAGTTRAVGFSGDLEEGDRVVLDSSGTVVCANLGKPVNDCSFSESTGVTWDDIGGLADAKAQLIEAIESPVRHKDLFARYGKRQMRGALLYGPPGVGKTLLGRAAATALADVYGEKAKGGYFYVKAPELLNMYVGNTEANIRKVFDAARRHKKLHGFPAIIFVDEADAILGKRGGASFGLNSTTVPQFLSEMDGLEDSGAFVLLATNRPDSLDPAVVRDGRIDRRIKVSRPDREASRDIFLKHLRGKPLGVEVHADVLAESAVTDLFSSKHVLYRVKRKSKGVLTDKMTLSHVVNGAMIAGVVDRASSSAMARFIAGSHDDGISAADVTQSIARVHAESLDVNHDEEIFEFCSTFMLDVADIKKAHPSDRATAAEKEVA